MAKLRMQFDNVVHEYEYRSDETYLSAVSKTVEQFKGSGVVRFPFAYRLETLTGREVNISGWMNEKMINVPAELLSVKIFAQIIDGPYDGDNNSENICFAKHPTIEGNLCAFPKGHDGVHGWGTTKTASDDVNHPKHYNAHPSGIECIDVVEHMPFNIGNAIKYLWRADLKGATIQDLDKAVWYIEREKSRLQKMGGL